MNTDSSTTEAEQLSQVIGKIYDAALDPGAWPGVMQEICGFVGCSSGMLLSEDRQRATNRLYYQWGFNPDWLKLYFEKYWKLNPVFPAQTFLEVGDVRSVFDLVPREEHEETRFDREWVRPGGMVDCILVTTERSGTSEAGIALQRHVHEGLVDAECRRRMCLVAPHIRRAVLIGKVVEHHKLEAQTFTSIVDRLDSSVYLVDEDSQITYANPAARSLADKAQIVGNQRGTLTLRDPGANQALRQAVAAASDGDTEVGDKGVAVTLAADSAGQHFAHMLPLTSGSRRQAGKHHESVAAVCVRKAAFEIASPLKLMSQSFGLTASETRVLGAVVELGSVSEMADGLGISPATVKTHLQRLFDKTGARRQIDLIKLVAGHQTPFRT